MNLGKIKFEKVNMKIVIAIGVFVIALLTAAFIIFRTNLIIDHDKNNNPDAQENDKENGNNDSEDNDDEETPIEPGTEDNKDDENDDDKKDDEKEEPNYDDPEEEDENTVSKEAKKRTKDKSKLTEAEKHYIIQENVTEELKDNDIIKKDCVGNTSCRVDVDKYNKYKSKKDKLTGCSGKVNFTYNKKKDKFVFDMSEVKCK